MNEPEPSVLQDLLDEVHRIEVQSNRLVSGALAGGYRSVFRGSGMEFDEVREYAEGDDPRTVDWSVTARVGRPYVKKYVDERDLAVMFLVDLSASMDAGYGVWSARQMAARICGCLALSAVKNNDKVGLVAFGHEVQRFVPPGKGFRHALRLVRDCLALPAASGTGKLEVGIDFAQRTLKRRAIVFLISDFLDGDWFPSLRLCARHHDVIAVRVASPEWAPPSSGLWRVADPETGAHTVLDWRSPRVRKGYAERVQTWKRRTEQLLRRAHVDLMEAPVPRTRQPASVSRPVLEFFRMRELRGGRR